MAFKGLAIGMGMVLVLGVFGWLFFTGAFDPPGQYDSFAQCLSAKGVKMYGAYWCSHCKSQKELFGGSWKYVNYIECALPGNGGQNAVCQNAGIQSYPTWEFGDGTRADGELSLQKLADKTACALTG
ncbi:MAG: hypothetical protein HY393_00920 [Candidatus Diapherotrites archaeon]|nr:hypothetical protein [Candidatus Diapherotrites archaeon]